MEHDTPVETVAGPLPSRCAQCGGSLRPGAPWCSLCLTPAGPARGSDRTPDRAPDRAPEPSPRTAPAALDPLTAPLELLLAPAAEPAREPHAPAPTWPCTSCSAVNPLDATTCSACGSGFLEQVRRSEGPLLVLPLVGDLSRLDKLQSLVLATAVVVVLLLVTLLAGVLLG